MLDQTSKSQVSSEIPDFDSAFTTQRLNTAMEEPQKNLFDCLPEELIQMIFDAIWDCKTLVRCMVVSKAFYHYAAGISSLCIVCPDNYRTYEEKLKNIFSMVKKFRQLKILVARVGHPKDEPAPWSRCMRYAEIGSSVEKFIFMAAKGGDFAELDSALTRLEFSSVSDAFSLNGSLRPNKVDEQSDQIGRTSILAMESQNGREAVDAIKFGTGYQSNHSLSVNSGLLWSLFLQRRLRFQDCPRNGQLSDFSLKQVIAPTNDVMKQMLPVIHFAILHGLNEFRDVIPFFVANFPKLRRFLLVDLVESVTIHLRHHQLDEIRILHMQDMAEWDRFERDLTLHEDIVTREQFDRSETLGKKHIADNALESKSDALTHQEKFETNHELESAWKSEDNFGNGKLSLESNANSERKGKGLLGELHEISESSTNAVENSDVRIRKYRSCPKAKELISHKYQNLQGLFHAHANRKSRMEEEEPFPGDGLIFSPSKLSNSDIYNPCSSSSSTFQEHGHQLVARPLIREPLRTNPDWYKSDDEDNLLTSSSLSKKGSEINVYCSNRNNHGDTCCKRIKETKKHISKLKRSECSESHIGCFPEQSSYFSYCSVGSNETQDYGQKRMENINELQSGKHYVSISDPLDVNNGIVNIGIGEREEHIASSRKVSDNCSSSIESPRNTKIHGLEGESCGETEFFNSESSSTTSAFNATNIPQQPFTNSCRLHGQMNTTVGSRTKNSTAYACQQTFAKNDRFKILAEKFMVKERNFGDATLCCPTTDAGTPIEETKCHQDIRKGSTSGSIIRNVSPFFTSRERFVPERERWKCVRRHRDIRRVIRISEDWRRDWDAQSIARNAFQKRKNDLEKEALSFDYSFWRADQVVTENYNLSEVSMCIATFSAKPLGEADIEILSCAGLAGPLLAATVSYVNKNHSSHNL